MEDPEKNAKNDLEEYKKEVADKERLFEVAVLEAARRSTEDRQVHLDLERAVWRGTSSLSMCNALVCRVCGREGLCMLQGMVHSFTWMCADFGFEAGKKRTVFAP